MKKFLFFYSIIAFGFCPENINFASAANNLSIERLETDLWIDSIRFYYYKNHLAELERNLEKFPKYEQKNIKNLKKKLLNFEEFQNEYDEFRKILILL